MGCTSAAENHNGFKKNKLYKRNRKIQYGLGCKMERIIFVYVTTVSNQKRRNAKHSSAMLSRQFGISNRRRYLANSSSL